MSDDEEDAYAALRRGLVAINQNLAAVDEQRDQLEAQIRATAFGFVVCVSVGGGEVSATVDPVSFAGRTGANQFFYAALTTSSVRVIAYDDLREEEGLLELVPDAPQLVVSPVVSDGGTEYQEQCTFCLFVGKDAEVRAMRWQEQTVAAEQTKLTAGGK